MLGERKAVAASGRGLARRQRPTRRWSPSEVVPVPYDRQVAEESAPSEIAYYYPEPFWLAQEGGWIKSLLLFFDEVAILLPDYMRGRHEVADPSLAEPLEDQGLLRILEPEWFVDEATTTRLAEVVESLVNSGAFDGLAEGERFAELSMSRMGYRGLRDVAHGLYVELERRGLASETKDGVSVPMHPAVRGVYLVVLAQLAREAGVRHHLDLHPVTNGRGAAAAFERFLALEPMPSRGQVVSLDLEVVSIDLDDVPLNDVLEYRRENADAHRRYMQNLRRFALDLSMLDEADRVRAIADRRTELRDEARDLRRRAVESWRSAKDVAGFGLGITGAAWALAASNPVPAALGALGAGLTMLPNKASGSAYSYVFRAKRALP